MADVFGPRPKIFWRCVRDCKCGLGAQPATTTVPNTTDMAIARTPRPGLLRRDYSFRRPRRSPSHPSATKIAPRSRPLRLAHLPDELSEETHARPLARSAESVRRRLLSRPRLPAARSRAAKPSRRHLPGAPCRLQTLRTAVAPFPSSRPLPAPPTGFPNFLELDPHPQLVAAGLLPLCGIAHLELAAASDEVAHPGGVLGVEEIQHSADQL